MHISSLLFLATAFAGSEAFYHEKRDDLKQLFARQAKYPASLTKGPTPKPEWVARLNELKAAGKIPNIAPSTLVNDWPSYPANANLTQICSWTTNQCFGPNDVHEAPSGQFPLTFDDGPQPSSKRLYDYLAAQNQKATFFMIGTYVMEQPALFKQALDGSHHIGVHTFSHPLMSSLSDEGVLGELGWTMQLIYDQSNGLIPAYWRPPYGDQDARVRAIAEQVFSLTAIIWNVDTQDWSFSQATLPKLEADLKKVAEGPKTPGVMTLAHDVHEWCVTAFINFYPQLKSAGWKTGNVPEIFGWPWYRNAASGNNATSTGGLIGPNDRFVVSASGGVQPTSAASSASSGVSGSVTRSASATASTTSNSADNNNSNGQNGSGGATVSVAFTAALLGVAAFFFRL